MSRRVLVLAALALVAAKPPDGNDWASYNNGVLGTRHNAAEKSLDKANVARLILKWRYPPASALLGIGVVHGTPVVVNGYTYFGTATFATVYKLTPSGKLKWSYAPRTTPKPLEKAIAAGLPDSGFLNSPLVTADTVYITDVGGTVYALDRATGKERWTVNSRARPFPGAHSSNCFFAAPIMADGKLIVAGGGFEHFIATVPGHKCCTGRGFVAALDPRTGKVIWKYEVGETPRPLKPPVVIKDGDRTHTFHFGPSTSSVWSTPSYDGSTIYFGTDTHNAPRQPTKDDPRLHTRHSCAIAAIDAKSGKEKWVTQVNAGDVWNYSLRTYDPKTGLYKDQSVGDTPKPFTIIWKGKPRRVVGAGCKNGVFYILDAATGKILRQTPLHRGAPSQKAKPGPRVLALPGAAGGLQTGCATDGKAIYTNGMDMPMLAVSSDPAKRFQPPIGGRVTALALDLAEEHWRHERKRVKEVGGFKNVGDPVASGIALSNGVGYFTTTVSNRLVAVDLATGKALKEIALGPVWSGPSVSRGRVWVGTGNILFSPLDPKEAYFPKSLFGSVRSFGLPGKDEVDKLGEGNE